MARLIDADKLMLSLADWELQESPIHTYEKPREFTADDMQKMIWRTIRDCESAVEEQPTINAIPIEWINNYINSIGGSNGVTKLHKEILKTMLKDWERRK